MKVSQKQFEEFKKECLRLQKEWGLNGYRLFFYFKELESRYAESETDLKGMTASIRLSSELSELALGDLNISEAAKHEMIHVLLGRVLTMGYTRFIDKKEMVSAEEEVVRILEKIL